MHYNACSVKKCLVEFAPPEACRRHTDMVRLADETVCLTHSECDSLDCLDHRCTRKDALFLAMSEEECNVKGLELVRNMCVPGTDEVRRFIEVKRCTHDIACLRTELCVFDNSKFGECKGSGGTVCKGGKCQNGFACVSEKCVQKCFSAIDCTIDANTIPYSCINPATMSPITTVDKSIVGFCVPQSAMTSSGYMQSISFNSVDFAIRDRGKLSWQAGIPQEYWETAERSIASSLAVRDKPEKTPFFSSRAKYGLGAVIILWVLCITIFAIWIRKRKHRNVPMCAEDESCAQMSARNNAIASEPGKLDLKLASTPSNAFVSA